MNRPVIKGTANHKASIAKAKADSIVSQRRTQADASLVGAGKAMGESYIPAAIDYSIKQKGIEFLDIKKEKGTPPPPQLEKMEKLKEPELKGPDLEKREVPELKQKDKKETYIEEPEDADVNDFSYIENNNASSNAKSDSANPKPYKNWKIRQEEENIAAAEANKKRLDEASRQRAKTNSTKVKPKKSKLLPTNATEIELKKADTTTESKKTPKAHNNPEYNVKGSKYDSEGNLTSLGGVTDSPGYSYEQESDQWTYNGIAVESYEVPEELVDSEDENKEERENKSRNRNLNSNTPSNKPVEEDIIQPQPPKPVVEEKKTLSKLEIRKKRVADKKYNDPDTGKNVKDQMLKEGYVPNESKSPTQARDNRIYRNAIKGGAVRKNMIKSGYKPE